MKRFPSHRKHFLDTHMILRFAPLMCNVDRFNVIVCRIYSKTTQVRVEDGKTETCINTTLHETESILREMFAF